MTSKPCIRCGLVLGIEQFYAHPQMADGHLNKCKDCCRADAIKNRRKRIDYYRQYDRERFATERRTSTRLNTQRRYRRANPVKQAARQAVARAIRRGLVVRQPCERCGCVEVDAHHDDYSKPLNVRWLCRRHHLMEHGNYIEN